LHSIEKLVIVDERKYTIQGKSKRVSESSFRINSLSVPDLLCTRIIFSLRILIQVVGSLKLPLWLLNFRKNRFAKSFECPTTIKAVGDGSSRVSSETDFSDVKVSSVSKSSSFTAFSSAEAGGDELSDRSSKAPAPLSEVHVLPGSSTSLVLGLYTLVVEVEEHGYESSDIGEERVFWLSEIWKYR
jgi:hypothetical protein